MKMSRQHLERIVREEAAIVLKEFIDEAEKDKEDDEPEVGGADKDNDNATPDAPSDDVAPKKGAEKDDAPDEPKPEPSDPDMGEPPTADKDKDEPKPPADEPAPDEEVPTGDDPADDELSQDVEDPDEEEPEGSQISQELAQKTIQSITANSDVKDFPGFTVIEFQFEDVPHPLRILVGKSGMVKYHFKGALHNSL